MSESITGKIFADASLSAAGFMLGENKGCAAERIGIAAMISCRCVKYQARCNVHPSSDQGKQLDIATGLHKWMQISNPALMTMQNLRDQERIDVTWMR